MATRSPSLPDVEPNSEVTNPVGSALVNCGLGDGCPYSGAMKFLRQEKENRERVEGALAVQIDNLMTEIRKLRDQLTQVAASVALADTKLLAHMKTHRLFELAVLALAAGAGGFLSRWLLPGK